MEIKLLRISNFLLLSGLGIAYLAGDQHFESVFGPNYQIIQNVCGIVLLLISIPVALLSPEKLVQKRLDSLLVVAVLASFISSLGAYFDADYVPEQFIEHGLKLLLPIAYLLYIREVIGKAGLFSFLKILIALTFIGHGIFALGLHYVPGEFVAMTTTILGVSADQALSFLKIIGALDILFSILIFVSPRFLRISAIYLISWGFITALARVTYGAFIYSDVQTMIYYTSNTVFRLPHGLIPIALVYLAKKGEANDLPC